LSEGRFYLASNTSPSAQGQQRPAQLVQTEGNDWDSTSTQRFVWASRSIHWWNQWFNAKGNMTLHYNPTFDNNLRGVTTENHPNGSRLHFSPIADGIFNNVIRDQDDYAVIGANLRCSLGLEQCPL
jgi:hypothetical protein